MREMKDSGISWVGEIPKEWLCIKAKNIIKSNDGGVWGNEPTSTENDKIVLRSTEQTIDGKWIIEEPAKRDLSKIPYKNCLIKPNDLLITKSSGSSLHIGKPLWLMTILQLMNVITLIFCNALDCKNHIIRYMLGLFLMQFLLENNLHICKILHRA